MVRMAVTYQGDLHCEGVHEPSGTRIETDAPKDNEGRGERFSPTDLVGAALGSCMLTVMGIVAKRHAWEMTGARAEVEKDMVAQPLRRIGRLGLRIEMPAGIPASARGVLERAATTCPVHQSLHPDVKIELAFVWNASDARSEAQSAEPSEVRTVASLAGAGDRARAGRAGLVK